MQIVKFLSRANSLRVLVVLSCALYVFSFFFRDIFSRFISKEFHQLLAYDGFLSILDVNVSAYLFITIFLISHLGIFLGKKWGLSILVIYYALIPVVGLMSGMTVILPVEVFLGWIIMVLDFFIIFCLIRA